MINIFLLKFQEILYLQFLLIIDLSLKSQGFGQHGQYIWQKQGWGFSQLSLRACMCAVSLGKDSVSAAGVSSRVGEVAHMVVKLVTYKMLKMMGAMFLTTAKEIIYVEGRMLKETPWCWNKMEISVWTHDI